MVRPFRFNTLSRRAMLGYCGRNNMMLLAFSDIDLANRNLLILTSPEWKCFLDFSRAVLLNVRAITLLFLFTWAFRAVEIGLGVLDRLNCHGLHQIRHRGRMFVLTVGFHILPLRNLRFIHILKFTQGWIVVLFHGWLGLWSSLKSAILYRLAENQKVHLVLRVAFF